MNHRVFGAVNGKWPYDIERFIALGFIVYSFPPISAHIDEKVVGRHSAADQGNKALPFIQRPQLTAEPRQRAN